MKKKLIIAITSVFVLIVLIFITALIVSFTVVKSSADKINQKVAAKLSKLVRIPKGLPPQTKNFYETIYFWEMETPQGEIVGVRFRHTTGFDKETDKFEATLELPEGGDASIFGKVLSAVIADSQTLSSAQDIEKANFSQNPHSHYKTFKLSIKPETKQTLKITWDLEKESLIEGIKGDYQRLHSLPTPILKPLYLLQKLTLDLMAG